MCIHNFSLLKWVGSLHPLQPISSTPPHRRVILDVTTKSFKRGYEVFVQDRRIHTNETNANLLEVPVAGNFGL